MREIRLVGSLTYGRTTARADFDVALNLLADHSQLIGEMITHRFDLTSIQQAFETASDKRQGAIKVSVVPQ